MQLGARRPNSLLEAVRFLTQLLESLVRNQCFWVGSVVLCLPY